MSYKRSRKEFESDLQAQQSPFVFYGTPLPPLDPDVRDDGSYVPVWKQEVVDEKGRKRLHGAFTGGFSAGYFNTVGSKEGWTPSTFVSSRNNRHQDGQKALGLRVEDIMDEEDMAAHLEAQKVSTAPSFAGLGSTVEDSMRRNLLMDILRPSGDTMGIKLLQKMGWKKGQGVGPKIKRKARLSDDKNAERDEEDTLMFAPENSSLISFTRKDDSKGLGYIAEGRLSGNDISHNDSGDSPDEDDYSAPRKDRAAVKKNSERGSKQGGFGVGILNDTGSDEDDPYDVGPRISYNLVIGGDKKKKKKKVQTAKPLPTSANPLLGAKPVFVSKKLALGGSNSGFRKCHDGRLPLEGFVLAADEDASSTIANQDGRFPPPEIPKDWKSAKQAAAPSSQGPAKYESTAEAAKSSTLDPASRATILGESALPGKSVFDYLSAAARDRIASVIGRSNLPPALGESAPAGFARSEQDQLHDLRNVVPSLDKHIALAALGRGVGGWMPYADDEAKRSRYRTYLELQGGLRNALPERPPDMTKDAWVKELYEFAHAAEVFKPMTGMMASRFVSSSSSATLASETIRTGQERAEGQEEVLLSKPAPKPEDPAEAAAKIGMFGPMTRSVLQFYPTRLVCKRFNVRPPEHVQVDTSDKPGGAPCTDAAQAKSLELVSKASINKMMQEASFEDLRPGGGGKSGGNVAFMPPHKEMKPDPEKNEALEAERAGEAVFKAIFGSDEEDDD